MFCPSRPIWAARPEDFTVFFFFLFRMCATWQMRFFRGDWHQRFLPRRRRRGWRCWCIGILKHAIVVDVDGMLYEDWSFRSQKIARPKTNSSRSSYLQAAQQQHPGKEKSEYHDGSATKAKDVIIGILGGRFKIFGEVDANPSTQNKL